MYEAVTDFGCCAWTHLQNLQTQTVELNKTTVTVLSDHYI